MQYNTIEQFNGKTIFQCENVSSHRDAVLSECKLTATLSELAGATDVDVYDDNRSIQDRDHSNCQHDAVGLFDSCVRLFPS